MKQVVCFRVAIREEDCVLEGTRKKDFEVVITN